MQSLLLASGANINFKFQKKQADETQKTCILPSAEDPMSWKCDCYEQMLARCHALGKEATGKKKALALCLRAQFCIHENTCEQWKAKVCKRKKVKNMISKLNALLTSQSLLNAQADVNGFLSAAMEARRSSSSSSASTKHLDQSAIKKTCS
eukprot:gnl/TRDRNA2_/TRDRNA2_134006_c0_seq1.p1 gnl/TRDRNA2_/TRDRNA2_134006_c0~~gnl/TRDRNA2_/TRDRNA2_134006_c0_seq1.p1  ORF type:complete len:151 (-),score=32.61 gnl/TRDRNA2_/TRDRNA2_134006_c0_seq1:107-559(-)